VVDVQKQDNTVLHKVPDHDLEKGDQVKGRIDWERRLQLMQHHSTTHMINGATREVLGDHIWQAGAHKTVEKGRLDVTHYSNIERDILDEIEEEVRKMIWEDLDIKKKVMTKTKAEEKYG
ncbi:MAG: alanine--tRNA ligase, partial [Candidatus Aenigmatarchaeota archaeon]